MSMHNESSGSAAAKGSSDLNPRIIVAIVLAALAVVFIVQNTHDVAIKFLFWEFTFGMWFALLIALVLGLLLGWGLHVYQGRRKRKAAKKK